MSPLNLLQMRVVSVLLTVAVVCVCGEEKTEHGLNLDSHYDTDGQHNVEFDHEAILGRFDVHFSSSKLGNMTLWRAR